MKMTSLFRPGSAGVVPVFPKVLAVLFLFGAGVISPLASAEENAALLVEVESFAECGGWVLDQQFIDVMGSPYLLAHGLGKPCANAAGEIDFPAEGVYRVWVRTKDWAPEPEWAPGKFQVSINGKPLAETFGEKGDGAWIWQDGGSVEVRERKSARIELRDLSGFDGRCDAIFFTTDPNDKPPAEAGDEMRRWREKLLKLPQPPESAGKFDVVVVGGGLAGCSAAVTASRNGCRVALVQNRPVLGGNNSSEIGVHTGQWGIPGKLVTPELGGNYGHEIQSPDFWDGVKEDELRRQAVVDTEENITQFLGWHVFRAQKRDSRIASLDALDITSGEELRFSAPVFIDCTGDGWVGYHAGADFRYGQEARDEHNESLAPEQASEMTLGSSLLWSSAPGDDAVDFPEAPWATAVSKGAAATSGGWKWEYGHHRDTIWEAEEIRDHLLRAIYGAFATAKKQNPEKYARHELSRVNYIAGKRESRRLLGDYIMTQADCWDDTEKPDKVAQGGNPFDLHVPTAEHDFLVEVDHQVSLKERRLYDIPLRCLYSRNVSNLLMAGRCVSATRIAHSSMRIQNTGAQNGVAAGAAAALCVAYDMTPREVGQKHLAELQDIVFAKGLNTEPAQPAGRGAGQSKRLTFPADIDTDGDGLISQEEWTTGKPEWEWLFPLIDTGGDGRIDGAEYDGFQDYKARNPDWQTKRPADGANQEEIEDAGLDRAEAETAAAAFLVSSHRPDALSFIDAGGKILRQITEVKHPQDVAELPDGRIFSSEISGAGMFDPEGKVLWQYRAPEGSQNPVAQVLGEDRFLVGNEGPCRLREINSKGETLKMIQLTSSVDRNHGQFRFCRKTAEGTYLVPFTNEGAVREYDENGNVVRDFGEYQTPVSVLRLDAGHTLIGWHHRVTEVDERGGKVWEFDMVTDGGLPASPVTGLIRLENGNVIFGCYHRDAAQPDLLEVTPDKEIVRNVTIPELDNIAGIQEPGAAGGASTK